ncbi:hypothetical protein [Gracilimonas sp. BCB1]|uniref:hypothetical protein n=1 Tax=Gracilimonas sp. BCB1 TaxID=3152362 RepID=UPI0032D9AD3C
MKETPNKSQTDRFNPYLIRDIIYGYGDIKGEDGDTMYEAYKRGYQMLYNDLQRTKAEESPSSFHVILEKAATNIYNLRQRSAAKCMQIEIFSKNFLEMIYEEAHKADSAARDFLTFAYDEWKSALENYRLREGIELIRSQYYFMQCLLPKDLEIEIFGDIKSVVLDGLNIIENKIVEAAEKHKVYEGLNNAHSYALTKGHLIPFEEFRTTASNFSKELRWCGPNNESIRGLINYGHSFKTACKIKFINLTGEKGKGSKEAYYLIYDELKELGIDPDESGYLPDTPKNMLDRCNRYQKNRMEELKQITRISSR